MKNNLNVIIDSFDLKISEINCAVVFFYCTWANVEPQWKNLLFIQEKNPSIKIYFFDIEKEQLFMTFKLSNDGIVSHGNGETYWVVDGKIIHKILQYKSPSDLKFAEQYSKSLIDLCMNKSGGRNTKVMC